MTREKPILKIGNEYNVRLYHQEEVRGKYLGYAPGNKALPSKHVFDSINHYVFVDDHWLSEDNEVITHTEVSSFSILSVPKDQLKLLPLDDVNSHLIKLLDNLGFKR